MGISIEKDFFFHTSSTCLNMKGQEGKWSIEIISYSLPLTIFTYFPPESLLSLSQFNLQPTLQPAV